MGLARCGEISLRLQHLTLKKHDVRQTPLDTSLLEDRQLFVYGLLCGDKISLIQEHSRKIV